MAGESSRTVSDGPPDEPDAEGDAASAGPARRRRRWPRRLGLTVLAVLVAATSASFGYNAATAGRATPPSGQVYVPAADITTRYRRWGSVGTPIVLVHGAAESADTWERVAAVLSARHRVYALDVTGWGYSERRAPFDADHEGVQLLGFLDALGLRGATLAGHSSGAAVLAAAALRDPAAVGGVLFLDGDGLDTGAGSGAGVLRRVLIDPYRTSLLRLAVRSDWVIRRIYGSQCGPACPRLDRAGIDRWRRPFQVPGAERGFWRMSGVVGLPAGRLAGLARLPLPKAVVFGAGDRVFARSAPWETATRIGAPAPTVIPGARHLSLISHPAEVAAAVDALAARRR